MNPTEDTSAINQSPVQTEQASAPEPPLDLTQALWQVRMICCSLGLGLLVVSLALSAFIWKENRNITAETNARIQQATRIQANQQQLQRVVEELARYSVGNAELTEIFKRSGININPPAASNAVPPSALTPVPGVNP